VNTTLAPGMKNRRTTYTCPLCKHTCSKREFESHVLTTHSCRIDEAFAMLFGISFPNRCTCGKELHYSQAKHGFPKTCGNCSLDANVPQYKNAEDAHKHVEQLAAMLATARSEEQRLKKEAELLRIPIEQLSFPSSRYNPFLRRLTMNIRTYAVNHDMDKLKELANYIDSKIT